MATLGRLTARHRTVVACGAVLGMLAGAIPFGRVGRGDDRRLVTVVLVVLAIISAIVLGSAGVPGAMWLLPLYLIGGAMNAGLNVLAGVVVGRRVPAAVRGRVAGTFSSVTSAASVIGYALGGLLMPVVPPRWLLAGTGAVGLLVAFVFLVPVLTARSRDARPEPAPKIAATVG